MESVFNLKVHIHNISRVVSSPKLVHEIYQKLLPLLNPSIPVPILLFVTIPPLTTDVLQERWES